LIGIRSAIPFLCAGALLALARVRWLHTPHRQAWLWGILAGVSFSWSNDYGTITTLVLLATYALTMTEGHWLRRISQALFCALVTAGVAAGIVTLATVGHPLIWLKDNFGGVADDQYWYF